jgi:hypothetical protein
MNGSAARSSHQMKPAALNTAIISRTRHGQA